MPNARIVVAAVFAALCTAGTSAADPSDKVAANAILVCEHADYIGQCQTYRLEEGKRHVLVHDLGALADKASSIAVGADVEAWVFDEARFSGRSAVVAEPRRSLCPGAPVRSFCEYVPFPWSPRSGFSHYAGTGTKAARTSADVWTGTLNQEWNDRIGSLIVYVRNNEPEGVFVMPKLPLGDPAALARFFPLPEERSEYRRRYSSLAGLGSVAGYVRVQEQVEVILFEQADLKGKQLKIPGELGHTHSLMTHPYLGWEGGWDPQWKAYYYWWWYDLTKYQFAGKLASLEVRPRGWTMGMEAPERGSEGDPHRHRAPPAHQPGVVELEAIVPLERGRTGGASAPGSGSLSLDPGTDRPGHDYRNLDLPEARPELCRNACAADPACKAYTYVKPGIQGPGARCWLKKEAAPPVKAPCCVSGARTGIP